MPKYKVTFKVDLEYEIDADNKDNAIYVADSFWAEYIPEWKIKEIKQ
jgi:hypothetical protein